MSDPNSKIKSRQMILIGGFLAGVVVLSVAGSVMFDPGPRVAKEKSQRVAIAAPGTVEDKDAWRSQEAAKSRANENAINELRRELKEQSEVNKKLVKNIEDLKSDQEKAAKDKLTGADKLASTNPELLATPINGKVQGRPTSTLDSPKGKPGKAASTLNSPLNGQIDAGPPRRELEMISFGLPGSSGGNPASASGGDPEVLGFPVNDKAVRYGESKARAGAGKNQSIDFLPAGTFVKVSMLNGVDAPTGGQAQGNPLPIAFHVMDHANLANKYKLDIKDCRFIAAAWGDLSSERTMGRTESLTCIIEGETVEMSIKGTVIGEDGKAGIRGRLVSKQGQVLANSLLAGIAGGIGKAFNQAATTTSVSPLGTTQTIDSNEIAQAALGSGIGKAGESLQQWYLKQADKLFPVIETDGGRIVEILITKGAVYTGKANVGDDRRSMLSRAGSTSRRYQDD